MQIRLKKCIVKGFLNFYAQKQLKGKLNIEPTIYHMLHSVFAMKMVHINNFFFVFSRWAKVQDEKSLINNCKK